MTSITERLTAFYTQLDRDQLHRLADIYSPCVQFVDPVGTHQGLQELEHYFQRLLTNCDACTFRLHVSIRQNDIIHLDWTMTYSHPRLGRGSPIEVVGISVLRIKDDLIEHQRDYYDLGAMLYEQVPLIGSLVSTLRRRLAA